MVKHPPRTIEILVGGVHLEGDLEIPQGAKGIVVFAHGSGSSRKSPRNRYVAEELQKAGLATLLFDLLTAEEDRTYTTRFDIELLTSRLIGAVQWLRKQKEASPLLVSLFGASTGAAAALRAASQLGEEIAAVVSRGGRPDLALDALQRVNAPSLFIVGGEDLEVIELNRKAMRAMPETTAKRLDIVPNATHLFEEPGTLEQVAQLAKDWLLLYAASQPAGWEEC